MTGEMWAQLGFGGAFFGLAAFILQAMIRGTWKPANTVKLLLDGKDQLIAIKDEQIRLLTTENKAWKTAAEKQSDQISLFAEASLTTKHFFEDTPRDIAPPSGGTGEKMDA